MKEKLLPICIILMLLFTFVAGCADKHEIEPTTVSTDTVDEVKFAQVMEEANTAYIEALVSTSQKDISASQKALSTLVDKLNFILDNYGETPPEMYASDRNWDTEIKRAVLIAEYSKEVLDEGDIEAAHKSLEAMRDLFFSLHERNNVLRMGDHLTMFHMTMEEAITAANENNTEMLVSYIPKLEKQWQDVKDAEKPDSADANYNQSLAAVDTAIEMLDRSTAIENMTQVQQNAGSLKIAFAKVFTKYGVVIS